MDKYEYRMKTEQMLAHIEAKAYAQAMEIADTIDWRRVKNIVMLSATSEVYEMNENYEKSRDILFIAYDRAPDNKKIIYRLGILALKQGDLSEAMDCYDEFVTVAPKDPNQYILRYKILKLQNSSILLQIDALKAFKKIEYVERWAYELAKLYDEAGMKAECISECDDLILWFNESGYVKEALELKLKYGALTPAQEALYEQFMPVPMIQPVMPVMPVFEEVAPEGENTVHAIEAPVAQELEVEPIVEDLAATKIINAEELQQINNAMNQQLMQTVAIDTKAIQEAEEAEMNKEVSPQFVVRGTPVAPDLPLGAMAGAAAAAVGAAGAVAAANANGMNLEVPLKSRTSEVTAETTGQLRIDEIFSNWQDKQKEMEEAIAQQKAISQEKAAQEAKVREEEKRNREQVEENKVAALPDDIRRMMEDIEGGVDLSTRAEEVANHETQTVSAMPEQEAVVEKLAEAVEVENKGQILENDLYIEEEFHDNIFDAQEELDEMLAEQKNSSVEEISTPQAALNDIEAILNQGDAQEAQNGLSQKTVDTDLVEENLTTMSGDIDQAEAQLDQAYEMDMPDLLEEAQPLSRMEMAKAVATGRTAKLPTDDIAKALATGVAQQDTGYIVQGRYDLEAQSQVGLRAGLTEEQKKMFSYFVPVRGMSEQLVEVLNRDKQCETRGGTSNTGNLLIVGNKGSGKTVLAVDVVKAIQKNRTNSSGKVAIVTGEALNKKKISDIVGKLFGGALIIEKASRMNEKTITRLNKAMERETGEILVVLEDERKPLDSLLATNLEFRRKFTSRLEVPVFINDELVTFGQAYAKENGYRIDEMGILALYSRIDKEQKEDYAVSVADVKEILDEAMDDAQRGGVKKLAKKIFAKGDEARSRIVLTEKNFNL